MYQYDLALRAIANLIQTLYNANIPPQGMRIVIDTRGGWGTRAGRFDLPKPEFQPLPTATTHSFLFSEALGRDKSPDSIIHRQLRANSF